MQKIALAKANAVPLFFFTNYKNTKTSVPPPWRDKKLCYRTITKKSVKSIERDFSDPRIYPDRFVV